MNILHRDNLPLGGFAGLKEHRVVQDPAVFGAQANADGSWRGIGNFVYLADARFMPHGQTLMHDHHEVDVISVVVEGRILHEGSFEHGRDLNVNDVQVQSAGGEGFSHNEINPDDAWNRMIQIWVLPEEHGKAAKYRVYQPVTGKMTRIYGGVDNGKADFPAGTRIDVGMLAKGQSIKINEPFMAYVTRGSAKANGTAVTDGDMLRGDMLALTAGEDVQLILVSGGKQPK